MEGFLSRAGGPAAVSKNPASTLYDDVFGGPPKFDRRRDYADIFGDFKSSCSIPFLSLGDDGSGFEFGVGAGIDYGEVFGGLDFEEFAMPYDELVVESKRDGEDERTKEEATFSFQAKEASSQHSNMCPVAPPGDDNFTSLSNHPADCMFNVSYSKINLGSNQEACGTKHVAELLAVPGYSIVVDDSVLAFSSKGIDDPCNMVQCGSEMKNLVKSPTSSSDNGSRGSEFDLKDSQMQNSSGCADYENDNANFNYHSRSSSCQPISTMDAPCKVTKYVSASDVSLRTKPLRVPPPSRPPPKLGHTIGGSTSNVSSYINYSKDVSAKVVSGEQKHISRISSKSQRDHKASTESNTNFSGVEVDISSAAAASAAAIKEAMEIAEARIKIAKESLERKRDYINNGRKVANADMPHNERMVDKISRFSDPIKHKTIVKENNQTVKLSSQKVTEVKLVATGTTGSAASLADMLMQKTIVNDNKEADKKNFKEKTEVLERTVHQTKEVQQMVSGSDIKSLQSMTQVEGEPGNGAINQGYFEIINNKKKFINADFFELETVRQQTELMIENNDSSNTVNVNAAFPSDLARHNNVEDNYTSEMGENVARLDNDHKEEEIEQIYNMVPDASRNDHFFTELGHTTIINEEGSKELEEAQNVIEELKVLCACEQASASGGSICNQELFGSSEPGTKGEERVSDATFATRDCEKIPNSFAECQSGREDNTVLDKFEDTHGSEENDCTVADATCEPCERGEKITVSSEVAASVENEINAPSETSTMRVEKNVEAIPTGSCEKSTFREVNIEIECKVKESRVTQELVESGIASMDQISITIAKSEMGLEAELETGHVMNDLSNLDEGQEVAQQLQKGKPIAEAKRLLQEECDERKTENADVEVKLNYNGYNSEEVMSSMGNFEEHKVEVHSLDTTFNADASPEVLQRPSDEKLNIQHAVLLERRGNILSSTTDVRESRTIVSDKANGNTEIEVKLKDRRLEKERELAEDGARKLNEEREKEREREREREREKDRIGVERATQEAREAKERSEKFAVERMTADFRLRAFKEAREKAEKATAEAHEKLLAEKAREAVLRAERAAVERATAEARERLVERALAEKAAMDAKESTGKYSTKSSNKDGPHAQFQNGSSSSNSQGDDEPVLRCKARMDRNRRTSDRAAKALAEMNTRDILAQREQAERNRLAEYLDADVKRWSNGKEGNLRALLSTLQYILGPESGWQPIPLTDVITAVAVKKAYRKATLCVHPDKLQQRGASIQHKYICEKVFDLLKEAWNKFNSQGR